MYIDFVFNEQKPHEGILVHFRLIFMDYRQRNHLPAQNANLANPQMNALSFKRRLVVIRHRYNSSK